jgi:protein tyrosine phosphatase (PTP) superfamily phosphohydrolase (DUF442 family)
VPVRFDCHSCGEPWWAPPANGCPRCGYGATGTPDPIIWSVGNLPGTSVFVTAQLRDFDRFHGFVADGFASFIDVAGDAGFVWRPDAETIAAAGIAYARIPIEDTNVDLPDDAFDVAATELAAADGKVLFFCAAGLKRSTHLLYGVLRRRHDAATARSLVAAARPMADRFAPYIAAAERWAAHADTTAPARADGSAVLARADP